MGKIKAEDLDMLKKHGRLSEAALNEMNSKGMVSKPRKSIKRFFTTSDGRKVQFMHYWRGIGDSKPSKKMTEFVDKIIPLHNEYANKVKQQ